MTEDERAIRTLVEKWMSATRSGDMQALRDLMTEDVIFLTPGAEPFGRDIFLGFGLPEGTKFDGATDIREIVVEGALAYVHSHIDVTITPPTGAAVRRAGHALGVFRKGGDGRWRLARDANLVAPVG